MQARLSMQSYSDREPTTETPFPVFGRAHKFEKEVAVPMGMANCAANPRQPRKAKRGSRKPASRTATGRESRKEPTETGRERRNQPASCKAPRIATIKIVRKPAAKLPPSLVRKQLPSKRRPSQDSEPTTKHGQEV